MLVKKPVTIIVKKRRNLTMADIRPAVPKVAAKEPKQQARTEDEKKALMKAKHKADKQLSHNAAVARNKLIKALRKQLCAEHPAVFNTDDPKPLIIGVHKEIQTLYPEYSNRIISFFLHRWVRHPKYAEAVKDPGGCKRYGIMNAINEE